MSYSITARISQEPDLHEKMNQKNPTCAQKLDTSDYYTPYSEVKTAAEKTTCRNADFIKIPVIQKKKFS